MRYHGDEFVPESLSFLQRGDILKDSDDGIDITLVVPERRCTGDDRYHLSARSPNDQLCTCDGHAIDHRLDHRHGWHGFRRLAEHRELIYSPGHELRGMRL